jgi:hypothetical protein
MGPPTFTTRLFHRAALFALFFVAAAASFNGYYQKWHFAEADMPGDHSRASFETMVDGAAGRHLPTTIQQHAQIAAAINIPLYLVLSYPGELRDLSLLYITLLLAIAANAKLMLNQASANSIHKHPQLPSVSGTSHAFARAPIAIYSPEAKISTPPSSTYTPGFVPQIRYETSVPVISCV